MSQLSVLVHSNPKISAARVQILKCFLYPFPSSITRILKQSQTNMSLPRLFLVFLLPLSTLSSSPILHRHQSMTSGTSTGTSTSFDLVSNPDLDTSTPISTSSNTRRQSRTQPQLAIRIPPPPPPPSSSDLGSQSSSKLLSDTSEDTLSLVSEWLSPKTKKAFQSTSKTLHTLIHDKQKNLWENLVFAKTEISENLFIRCEKLEKLFGVSLFPVVYSMPLRTYMTSFLPLSL